MIVVLTVYNALTAFTTYDLVYAMTGGGPGTATTLLSFQIRIDLSGSDDDYRASSD